MDQNEVLFDRAQKSIPGGVNSPVRRLPFCRRRSPLYKKSITGRICTTSKASSTSTTSGLGVL